MAAQHARHSEALTMLPVWLIIIAGMCLYLLAAFRQRGSNRGWNPWCSIGFVAACLLLLTALSTPMHDYARQDLRGHMLQHLLIGMLVPLGLVFAAPVTLAYRSLPAAASRLITAVLRSDLAQFLCHPFTALLLNIGGMYLLYLTPLFAISEQNTTVHNLLLLHFLLAGCLYTWAIAGPDPAPGRPCLRLRLLVLFIGIAAHANLSKFMYIRLLPAGTGYEAADIQSAALWMYYGGDFSELLLVIALFASWYRQRAPRRSLLPV